MSRVVGAKKHRNNGRTEVSFFKSMFSLSLVFPVSMDVPSIEQDLLELSLFESVASDSWTAIETNAIPNLSTSSADEDSGSESNDEEGEAISPTASLLFRTPEERTEWGNLLGELRRVDMEGPEVSRRIMRESDARMQGLVGVYEIGLDEVDDYSDPFGEESWYDALDEGPDASPRLSSIDFDSTNSPHQQLILPDPRHQVGTVFTHRVYGYLGVILGWSRTCNASESWQRNMVSFTFCPQ